MYKNYLTIRNREKCCVKKEKKKTENKNQTFFHVFQNFLIFNSEITTERIWIKFGGKINYSMEMIHEFFKTSTISGFKIAGV